MIPVEAVEAAAKAVWYGGTAPGCGYGDIPAAAKSTLEKDVREILEAAAPYIAGAWHDAVSEAYVEGALSLEQASVMWNKNPYRTPNAR